MKQLSFLRNMSAACVILAVILFCQSKDQLVYGSIGVMLLAISVHYSNKADHQLVMLENDLYEHSID